MKAHFISGAVLLLITHLSPAQVEYNHNFNYIISFAERWPIIYQPSKNVDQITFSITNHRTGKDKKVIKNYDLNGRMIAYFDVNRNGIKAPYVKLRYNAYDRAEFTEEYSNGKLRKSTTYTYADSTRIESQEQRNRKGAIIFKNTWKYDTASCLASSTHYKRGGMEVGKMWTYSYYKKCEKSRSILYNGKGKILNEWTYDCKKEGEQLEKKKNTTQVCRWEIARADTLIEYAEQLDTKGRTTRRVSKYTSRDTLILQHLNYNYKGQLTSSYTYDKSYDKMLNSTLAKRGKELFNFTYTYEEDLLISWTSSAKGKFWARTEYKYNGQKLLTEYREINKREKLKRSVILEYVM